MVAFTVAAVPNPLHIVRVHSKKSIAYHVQITAWCPPHLCPRLLHLLRPVLECPADPGQCAQSRLPAQAARARKRAWLPAKPELLLPHRLSGESGAKPVAASGMGLDAARFQVTGAGQGPEHLDKVE